MKLLNFSVIPLLNFHCCVQWYWQGN